MLYDWNTAPLVNDIYVFIPRIICMASALDAFWILTFLMINSLLHRNFSWLRSPERRDYITLLILGIICAIIIELWATVHSMWSYNQFMPLIFGIGLTPLIQLALTSAASLYFSTKIK